MIPTLKNKLNAYGAGAGARASPAAWSQVPSLAGLRLRRTAGAQATDITAVPATTVPAITAPRTPSTTGTTNLIAGAAATRAPTTALLSPTATAIGASCDPPTPIMVDPIRWFGIAGIVTTGRSVGPTRKRPRSGRRGLIVFTHHHSAGDGPCRSKASCRSGTLCDSLAARLGCGRRAAETRVG